MGRLTALAMGVALLAAACGGGSFSDPRLQSFDDPSTLPEQQHLTPGTVFTDYTTIPPVSGPHDPFPLQCGIYTSEQPYERALHAMEHGAIIIYYDPATTPAANQAQLEEIGGDLLRDGKRIIVMPHANIGAPIVVTAWARKIELTTVEAPTIRDFANAFENQAPERIARGQACSGAPSPSAAGRQRSHKDGGSAWLSSRSTRR